jgi:hypothetical protein
LYKKLLVALFVLLAGTSYVTSTEVTTGSLFGKNLAYGAYPQNITLGQSWSLLNTALTNAESANYYVAQRHLGMAHQIYTSYFKEGALEVDPESDRIIESMFSSNSEHIKIRDFVSTAYNRQAIDRTIDKIAYMKLENALDEGDVDTFLKWYPVLETKLAIKSNTILVTNQAVVEIKENPDKIHQYKEKIKSEILNLLKTRVVSEIRRAMTAADAGNTVNTINAAHGSYYQYRAVHPHLINQIGQKDAEIIQSNVNSVMDVARSGAPSSVIKTELSQILKNVEPITAEFLFKNDDWRAWWYKNSIKSDDAKRYNSYLGKY